jgi:hypothetical protein
VLFRSGTSVEFSPYTGSIRGNIVSASISSNTASIDLSQGNYFTSLVSGSTHFNITNVLPGQTALIELQTVAIASASFSPNVKQPLGNEYIPTSGSGNIDIISLSTFNASNVYVVSTKKFS